MSDVIITTALFVILMWWSAPRIFRLADTRLARQIVFVHVQTNDVGSRLPYSQRSDRGSDNLLLVELAAMCDSLARATRGGASPSEAMRTCVQRHGLVGEHWIIVTRDDNVLTRFSDNVAAALQHANNTLAHDDARCLSLISLSTIHDNLVPAALDHASQVLRDCSSCRNDMMVAASQARLSARMLTALPFVLCAGAVAMSHSFRSSLLGGPVLFFLVLGLILNRIGWRWISRHIAHSISDQPSDTELLTDHLCVSLRAGLTIAQACERWSNTSPIGALVARSLQNGETLEDALRPLYESSEVAARALVDVVMQAERDGLPVLETVNRLSTETRAERRRLIDTRIRQLPTRLSVPLVVCVLPSFLLMSIVPLILASLSHLSISLPSVTS